MEVHKERYFRSFVRQSTVVLEDLVGKMVVAIRKIEEIIRGCYVETINLNSDRFVRMILVDAGFIIELFYSSGSDDPIFVSPRVDAVMLDLLLLENQLPFFVIEKLHHLAFPSLSDNDRLLVLSFKYFKCFNFRSIPVHPNVKIEHFTDLLRTFQIPPVEKRPKRDKPKDDLLYTATQLYEAGVKFKVVNSECRFDIKFEKGVLKIPKLVLDDWTEVVTRNVMALEQVRYMEDACFTDYFFLIDSLMNNSKDVDFLCNEKILVNSLGDNNAPVSMINNLNKGIMWITVRKDYIDIYNELNSFCEKPWNKWKATLKREYFGTPWRGASTVAAIILLVLAFMHAACSILK